MSSLSNMPVMCVSDNASIAVSSTISSLDPKSIGLSCPDKALGVSVKFDPDIPES